MVELLLSIKKAVTEAVAQNQPCLAQEQVVAFETRYDALVRQGLTLNPVSERLPGQRGKIKQPPPKNLENIDADGQLDDCSPPACWPRSST